MLRKQVMLRSSAGMTAAGRRSLDWTHTRGIGETIERTLSFSHASIATNFEERTGSNARIISLNTCEIITTLAKTSRSRILPASGARRKTVPSQNQKKDRLGKDQWVSHRRRLGLSICVLCTMNPHISAHSLAATVLMEKATSVQRTSVPIYAKFTVLIVLSMRLPVTH